MKPIQIRKTTIDIPFTDKEGNEVLTLYFDRSDESVKRLYEAFDDIQEQADKLQASNEQDSEKIKDFLQETIDILLGEGSFEEMYQLSPSLLVVATYFAQIAIGIKEELEQEDIQAIENQYLK